MLRSENGLKASFYGLGVCRYPMLTTASYHGGIHDLCGPVTVRALFESSIHLRASHDFVVTVTTTPHDGPLAVRLDGVSLSSLGLHLGERVAVALLVVFAGVIVHFHGIVGVAARLFGMAEKVRHEVDGLHFRTASPESLADAMTRLDRVPAGFMRDMTREEVEKVARDKGATTIDLALCEEGIGHARETMNEVIAGYVSNKKPR